ncbi:MAG: branched-chain amino acid ABC transporter permease [Polaromonas sp.]|uniref:branched-chain amino acid ABC transporter permease n=1 Tax=Polaromonas sp. TaxID=1869339 RepID=UPI0025EBA791|nr:branched-chain amino acid ABC transporter permease [Polaromonas sp.]MBI2725804.1 branched-chain amino acid ABC transporter permease [Polaromonas sp.]
MEQTLNGLQLGLMLFLLAAGLTLVFGIMDLINLAHGSLYMFGGFLTVVFMRLTGNFALALPLGIIATGLVGALLEMSLLRRLYGRSHLSQVLATFGLILVSNDVIRFFFGPSAVMLDMPAALSQPLTLANGFSYSSYRLVVIAAGIVTAILLSLLINRTRFGMWIRAGASDRETAQAMGVNIKLVFTLVFALGAMLCALAGGLLGPLFSVQMGMGESIIILAFVVVVIGGMGSIKGAFLGAIAIGFLDTFGRSVLPSVMRTYFPDLSADTMAPAIAAMLTYALMIAVLIWRPQGLFKTA